MSLVLLGSTSGSVTLQEPAVAGSSVLSLPAVTDTLAGIAATQTLTNKTLTSPTLTTPVASTTIGVGGATASASGAGITFPATQSASSDANTLDDYEEGTWTPIDSSGASLSFTDVVARYTKIGRMVECFAQIVYPTTVNTSQATIGGLPFTNASTTGGSYGAFTVYQSHSTATTWLNSSANTISVAYSLGTSGITNVSLSTHNIRLVWIYEV